MWITDRFLNKKIVTHFIWYNAHYSALIEVIEKDFTMSRSLMKKYLSGGLGAVPRVGQYWIIDEDCSVYLVSFRCLMK